MMHGVGSENSCGGKTSRDLAGVQERCRNVATVSFHSGANAMKSRRFFLIHPSTPPSLSSITAFVTTNGDIETRSSGLVPGKKKPVKEISGILRHLREESYNNNSGRGYEGK